MRIFVAGATGVVGRRLVPLLVQSGHEVIGSTRTPNKVGTIEAQGARGVLMDALDTEAVKEAVSEAAPEVVVHELTAIPAELDFRRFSEAFETTDRLRTEGTDRLLAAASAAGVRRIVAQSYAAWPYEKRGGWVKTEDDPLDDRPPAGFRRTLEAIRHLESAVLGAGMEGVVLRYGAFYGPGTSLAEGGPMLEPVRRRRFPIVGSGQGTWSFLHIDDAAGATAIAVERGTGVYNITDDEPAAVRAWLPVLAEAIGARPPRRVPAWLARLLIGEAGVSLMTQIRGASNAKAKRELGWKPVVPTWRQGFRTGL
ncbi:MAG TPA: NAD(P)-dependent oxidoreductase [Actinomycetota bacterium]|jgi:nucleoside-diphosphate-sugar epimerase|nr:NAD(P)-dependent oxidoreductase [Actinomycetota bacterium]